MKREKSEVDYGDGMLRSHCGPVFHDDRNFCRHFIPGSARVGKCELVDGPIGPTMWCKLYERVAKRSS